LGPAVAVCPDIGSSRAGPAAPQPRGARAGSNRPRCRSAARSRSLGGQAGCAPPLPLPHQAHGQRL